MARGRPVLFTVWLGMFLVSLDYTALTIALPRISRHFDAGTSATSWALLAYTGTLVTCTLAVGALAERFGFRRLMVAGFGVFAVSSLGCALAPSLVVLSVGRALQAAGGAVLYSTGPAILRAVVPEEQQGRAFGLFAMAPSAGICLGPPIGGLLTSEIGWQAIFLINLPVCLWGLWRAQGLPAWPATRSSDRGVDLPGMLLGAAALLSLVFGLNQGQELGWGSPAIVASLVLSPVLGLAFALHERRAANPAMDLALFRLRRFLLGNLSFLGTLFAFGGAVFLLPYLLESVYGMRTREAGLVLLMQPAVMIAISALSHRMGARIPLRAVSLLGAGLVVLAMLLFARPGSRPLLYLLPALAVMGAGMGLYLPTNLRRVMDAVPKPRAGMGSAVASTTRSVAQLVGVVVLESVFSQLSPADYDGSNRDVGTAERLQLVRAFSTSFHVAAAVALVGMIPLLLVRRGARS